MRVPILFLTTLLAASNALSVPTKRAPTDHVVDGSFEDINDAFEFNTKLGGWTFTGGATVDDAGPYEAPPDPAGTNFVAIYNLKPGDRTGSVSQRVSGLTGGTFTLSYIYKIDVPDSGDCTLTVSLGSQTLDTVGIPSTSPEQGPWVTRTETFTPAASSGTLKLAVACPRANRGTHWAIYLDDVQLVGPN